MRAGIHHIWQDPGNSDAELQADVMRFVAIVALCIVAISSLVEEADTSKSAVRERVALVQETEEIAVRETALETSEKQPLASTKIPRKSDTDPLMVPALPVPPPKSAIVRTGGAEPITLPDVQAPGEPEPDKVLEKRPPPQTQVPEAKKGFTLRFESDAALLGLIEAGRASLFVFGPDDTLRLSFDKSGPRFLPAAQPRQFHAITPNTVPVSLQAALSDSGHIPAEVVWGVTLPAATRSTLAGILQTHEGGELIIRSDGNIYLEDNDV